MAKTPTKTEEELQAEAVANMLAGRPDGHGRYRIRSKPIPASWNANSSPFGPIYPDRKMYQVLVFRRERTCWWKVWQLFRPRWVVISDECNSLQACYHSIEWDLIEHMPWKVEEQV